jgi:hypothetical protein
MCKLIMPWKGGSLCEQLVGEIPLFLHELLPASIYLVRSAMIPLAAAGSDQPGALVKVR